MIHFVKNEKGMFYYDDTKKYFGVNTNRDVVKETFQDMVDMKDFIGRDLKVHNIEKEPVLFLVDYVARVFGEMQPIQTAGAIT
jgi:hypothetical protein